MSRIQAIDKTSVHKITAGQVAIDLQTCVKELVENSLDSGATSIEVRFKQYGVRSIEVVDNGSGIAEKDHDSIALKHHTSKLSSFEDLTSVQSFGFRGEALSSICALAEDVTITTTTAPPMGAALKMDLHGRVSSRNKVARQRGTTVSVSNLFFPLPVRRKELEKNAKREFGKALALLNAYALGPCCGVSESGVPVRMTVSNQTDKGPKTVQIRTSGSKSIRATASSLFGTKAVDHLVDLDVKFEVERDKLALRRLNVSLDQKPVSVEVHGLVSKFAPNCGRTTTDRQFFFINGRPCTMSKVAKVFNEVYHSFNVSQSPFLVANFVLPGDTCDINVSPDKRTIFVHSEANLISALRVALEQAFSVNRSTLPVVQSASQTSGAQTPAPLQEQLTLPLKSVTVPNDKQDENEEVGCPADLSPPYAIQPQSSKADMPHRSLSGDMTALERGRGSESPQTTTYEDQGQVEKLGSEHGATQDIQPVPDGSPLSPGRSALDLENTVMDEGEPRPAPTSQPSASPEPEIVFDSTQAAWSSTKTNLSENSPTSLSPPPAKKPRLIGVKERPTFLGSSMPQGRSSNPSSSRPSSWKSKLSSFARKSSSRSQSFQEVSAVPESMELDDNDPQPSLEDPMSVHRVFNGGDDHQKETHSASDSQLSVENTLGAESTPEGCIDLTNIGEDGQPEDRNTEDTSSRIEVVKTISSEGAGITIDFDLLRLESVWDQAADASPSNPSGCLVHSTEAEDAGINNVDEEGATNALSRIIDKSDFASMEILGQFNLGFIITRRHRPVDGRTETDDLFIVDQHASDEKYNFETLQQSTVIESQRLIRPQPLELAAADELIAAENMDVLQKNGFEVRWDDSEDAKPGTRLHLIAHPVSKTTVFTVQDLEEIIHLLHDRVPGEAIRCSKTRAMFASRACRKSVMVGMPLTKGQMTNVVRHMGTLENCWSCPHGRPTMRHLCDLGPLQGPRTRKINWTTLLESGEEDV